ncbi:hypothetical protein GCM10023195_78330 [Actinoallomurus liliacearum]|uniref:Uncharacterized protein n=1 Tax=Actinoallomurus liliacearum TaxID=1080073 RepID=A0ABP8TYQ9_9ACTN
MSNRDNKSAGSSSAKQPAGGLPVDENGKRVYPNDATNNNTVGGQTSGPRTYPRGAGHYYGG